MYIMAESIKDGEKDRLSPENKTKYDTYKYIGIGSLSAIAPTILIALFALSTIWE